MGSDNRVETYYVIWDDGSVYEIGGDIIAVEIALSEDRLLFDSEEDARKYYEGEY